MGKDSDPSKTGWEVHRKHEKSGISNVAVRLQSHKKKHVGEGKTKVGVRTSEGGVGRVQNPLTLRRNKCVVPKKYPYLPWKGYFFKTPPPSGSSNFAQDTFLLSFWGLKVHPLPHLPGVSSPFYGWVAGVHIFWQYTMVKQMIKC